MTTNSPKILILATFVALSIGFGAGYWIGTQSGDEAPQMASQGETPPHPVGAQEYVQLGMSALSSGQFGEAERRFRQALDMSPDSPGIRTDLAVALMYQEKWDEAWEQIQEAKEAAPEMPEVYFLEGVVYRDARQDTAQAKEAWNRYLEMVPEGTPQAETVREWLAELDGETPPASPTSPAEETGAGQTGAAQESPSGD